MFEALPSEFLQLVAAAFVLGWLVAKFGTFLSKRSKSGDRDPRDDRIRSLEAEHRIAVGDAEKAKDMSASHEQELAELRRTVAEREQTVEVAAIKITQLRTDLKDSVKKTRELRGELTDRATENAKSESKLREVETELDVTRAGTDLIATGVLDYSLAPDAEDGEKDDSENSAVRALT